MNSLKVFFYGLFNKMTSLVLSIGLFKGLAAMGVFDRLKGEFYYIPAIVIVLVMVLTFSKYLSEVSLRNMLIMLPLFVTGAALLALT